MTKDKLNAEERDILDRFERGELRSAHDGEQEMEAARQAARKHVKQNHTGGWRRAYLD